MIGPEFGWNGFDLNKKKNVTCIVDDPLVQKKKALACETHADQTINSRK